MTAPTITDVNFLASLQSFLEFLILCKALMFIQYIFNIISNQKGFTGTKSLYRTSLWLLHQVVWSTTFLKSLDIETL
jgi:hypothetical protein